ncbi:MAG: helix-hairpin-helix domain-containing protein [Caldilineaceae bacterium]
MIQQESWDTLQQVGQETIAQAENVLAAHRDLLQTVGFVAATVAAGGVGGFLLAKGVLAAKGLLPITMGAVGGGGLVLAATRYQVGTLQDALTNQQEQSAAGEAERRQLAAALAATQASLRELRERLAAQTTAHETDRSQFTAALTAAQASVRELQAKLAAATTAPQVQERLEQIKGIGRAYAQKLHTAGIHTLTELAAASPDNLREIVGAGSVVQVSSWIEQARHLIQPKPALATPLAAVSTTRNGFHAAPAVLQLDRLEALPGLMPAQAARLNACGILTYGDLAGESATRLQALLGDENLAPVSTVATWIAAAQTLAA